MKSLYQSLVVFTVVLLVGILFLLTGCGHSRYTQIPSPLEVYDGQGSRCSVTQLPEGRALLTCEDGTEALIEAECPCSMPTSTPTPNPTATPKPKATPCPPKKH